MGTHINFYIEDCDFELTEEAHIRNWLIQITHKYKYVPKQLDFIFCSDEYLLKLNQTYLNHDDYTDILTFPYHPENSRELIGDIYISVDRVKENALLHKVNFIDELHRVMIHGVLHMVGFDDKTQEKQEKMRQAEDLALALRMF
jgi:rRNA maturation RNase YbeY